MTEPLKVAFPNYGRVSELLGPAWSYGAACICRDHAYNPWYIALATHVKGIILVSSRFKCECPAQCKQKCRNDTGVVKYQINVLQCFSFISFFLLLIRFKIFVFTNFVYICAFMMVSTLLLYYSLLICCTLMIVYRRWKPCCTLMIVYRRWTQIKLYIFNLMK